MKPDTLALCLAVALGLAGALGFVLGFIQGRQARGRDLAALQALGQRLAHMEDTVRKTWERLP